MPPPRRSSFPGLQGLSERTAERRRGLIDELVRARRESDLSQTEIAARWSGTGRRLTELTGRIHHEITA